MNFKQIYQALFAIAFVMSSYNLMSMQAKQKPITAAELRKTIDNYKSNRSLQNALAVRDAYTNFKFRNRFISQNQQLANKILQEKKVSLKNIEQRITTPTKKQPIRRQKTQQPRPKAVKKQPARRPKTPATPSPAQPTASPAPGEEPQFSPSEEPPTRGEPTGEEQPVPTEEAQPVTEEFEEVTLPMPSPAPGEEPQFSPSEAPQATEPPTRGEPTIEEQPVPTEEFEEVTLPMPSPAPGKAEEVQELFDIRSDGNLIKIFVKNGQKEIPFGQYSDLKYRVTPEALKVLTSYNNEQIQAKTKATLSNLSADQQQALIMRLKGALENSEQGKAKETLLTALKAAFEEGQTSLLEVQQRSVQKTIDKAETSSMQQESEKAPQEESTQEEQEEATAVHTAVSFADDAVQLTVGDNTYTVGNTSDEQEIVKLDDETISNLSQEIAQYADTLSDEQRLNMILTFLTASYKKSKNIIDKYEQLVQKARNKISDIEQTAVETGFEQARKQQEELEPEQ